MEQAGSEKRRESPDDEEVNKLTSIDGIHCYHGRRRRLHRKTRKKLRSRRSYQKVLPLSIYDRASS